ncbi:hypothetical protein ACJJIF_07295 [Microbulbifer sp. SSSA002]|uniref:hypothetical protein n=1 Tax=unclassified Microbulbifer TaxID=2619833 RepID=UPI004039F088
MANLSGCSCDSQSLEGRFSNLKVRLDAIGDFSVSDECYETDISISVTFDFCGSDSEVVVPLSLSQVSCGEVERKILAENFISLSSNTLVDSVLGYVDGYLSQTSSGKLLIKIDGLKNIHPVWPS